VGNELIKGISGGERKRASIGYELITNPRLLILDEPTSGLDSNTAFKLIQMLKRESERGMSIILTIHQPSSEIFMLFDKITLLSDGNTLYDGSPKEVFSFYNKLDLTIEKYVNPSDELLKLANNP
jgi:ABC-type multidrug transport system ATPase subunit